MYIRKLLALLLLFTIHINAFSQERPALIIPTGHSGGIADLAIDSTQNTLFSIGLDGQLKSWDMVNTREMRSMQIFDGHLKNIEHASLDISPSGRLAVVSDRFMGNIWLIDLITFKVKQQLDTHYSGTAGVFFSSDEKSLFVAHMGALEQIDFSEKVIKKWFEVNSDHMIAGEPYLDRIAQSPARNIFAVAMTNISSRLNNSTIQILDVKKGQVVKTFNLNSAIVNSMTFSADGRLLLIADDKELNLIDLDHDIVVKRDNYARGVACIDEANKCVLFCQQEGQIEAFDLKTLKPAGQAIFPWPRNTQITGIRYDPFSKLAIIGSTRSGSGDTQSGAIYGLDTHEKALVKQFRSEGTAVNTAAFSHDGTLLVNGSADGIARIWDLKNGGVNKQIDKNPYKSNYPTGVYFKKTFFSPDGKILVLNTPHEIDLYTADYTYTKALTYAQSLASGFSTDGTQINFSEYHTAMSTGLNIDSIIRYQPLWRFELDGTPFLLQNIANDKILAVTRNALTLNNLNDKKQNTFDLQYAYLKCAATLGQKNLVLLGGGFTSGTMMIFDYITGKTIYESKLHQRPILDLKIAQRSHLAVTASEDHTARIWDMSNPENPAMNFVLKGHSDAVVSCNFSADEKLIVTTSEDKTSKIWSAATGKELVTLIAFGEEWLMVTSDGYYFASTKGARLVHFIKNNKVHYFDQYDLIYNRPDIVLSRIGCSNAEIIETYKKAYEKRIQKMGIKTVQLNPDFNETPELEIEKKEKIVSITETPILSFNIKARSKSTTLERLIVKINGIPVYGIAGLKICPAGTDFSYPVKVELAPGINQIDVNVLDSEGILSNTEKIRIFYKAPEFRPTLYVVSVGLSHYLNSKMDLHYAAKDANDFAKHFSRVTGSFKDIKPYVLVDSNATKANILDLRKKLLQSRPGDQVIVFYAGHGQINGHDLYLSSYDQNFQSPQKNGLSYDEFEGILDSIPARGRIILIDACHSGEYDEDAIVAAKPFIPGKVLLRSAGEKTIDNRNKNSRDFDLMKQIFTDLRKSSGATIVSSASASEYAWEADRWQNGVFTSALLTGLEQQKADINKDGKIMLSEILRYLQQEVNTLTHGAQNPTLRRENIFVDFQLY